MDLMEWLRRTIGIDWTLRLRRRLLICDRQQREVERKLERLELERTTLWKKAEGADRRAKVLLARAIQRIERAIKDNEALSRVLEEQKSSLETLIRARQAIDVTQDPTEIERQTRELEALTAEIRLRQDRLSQAQREGAALESARIEDAPEESEEVTAILEMMNRPRESERPRRHIEPN